MASTKALIAKVESVLAAALPGFQSGIQSSVGNARVLGFVVSSEFTGQDHAKRQRRIRSILEESLSAAELLRVGPIAALSPEEAEVKRRAV